MEHMRDLLKKIKDSKRSGTSTDDIFKPAVWWFDFVSFLDPDLKGRVTTDNFLSVDVFVGHFWPCRRCRTFSADCRSRRMSSYLSVVCLSSTAVNCKKTADPIEVMLGTQTRRPGKHRAKIWSLRWAHYNLETRTNNVLKITHLYLYKSGA